MILFYSRGAIFQARRYFADSRRHSD